MKTYTETEIRKATKRAGLVLYEREPGVWPGTAHIVSEVMKQLETPEQVIPEGQLCWGWNRNYWAWVPCESYGDGDAMDADGNEHDEIRLIHPDRFPKDFTHVWLWLSGSISFSDRKPESEVGPVVYWEERS